MRIDIQAELTPELLAEAGIAYSTKDKVYGAKYRRKQRNQLIRGSLITLLGAAMLVMFFVGRRGEFLMLSLAGFVLGGSTLYAALVSDQKHLGKKLAQAGGETRHRRYLITDKKIESSNEEKKTLLRWTDFDRTMETKNCLILLGQRVLVLPKAAFDASQMSLLRAFLAEQFNKKA